MERLAGWLLTSEGAPVNGAEGLVSLLDVWFAGSLDQSWRDDDDGLADTLDVTPGWESWASWNRTEKIENLRVLLETSRDRAVLIPPDDELAIRLTELWNNQTWRQGDDSGLADALDQLPGWDQWDRSDLTLDTLRGWLTPLPAEWTGESGETDTAQPDTAAVPADLTEPHLDETLTPPRWRRKAEDGEFEHYNNDEDIWERRYGELWHRYHDEHGWIAADPEFSPPRWRRRAPDGDFEHHHDDDDVWERRYESQWYRYHSDQYGWLAYDHPSMTWLDTFADSPQWRPHAEVGQPVPAPQSQPAAKPQPPPDTDEALIQQLTALRQTKVAEMVARLESKGWEPAATEQEAAERREAGEESAMTREQLVELVDRRVRQLLGS